MTGSHRPANGPYEVHALRFATRSTLASEVYPNGFLFGEDDRELVMDYYCWLVRGSGRTILVDTGFTPEVGSRRGRTTTTPPLQGLAQLGVEPGDVDTVVITHAHYDHTGHVARFAHADIVIARRELDFWTGPYARRQQFAHSGEPDDIAVLAERDRSGCVTAFAGEYEMAPGVVLREVGGHTPGQLVAVVEAERGRVVLASDAVHYYEELERDRPSSSSPTSSRCTAASTLSPSSPPPRARPWWSATTPTSCASSRRHCPTRRTSQSGSADDRSPTRGAPTVDTTSFTGRTAIVTGAAQGIGADRAAAPARGDVAAEIGGHAAPVEGDVSREEDVERYMRVALERFGRVDLHHLNAGIVGSFAALPDLSVEDFDRVVAVNLRGPFLGVRAAFRQYLAQGGGGAMVLTASIASLRGSHDLLPYQSSKHGVLGVMRGAAMYGGPMGVRVNAVAPGLVPTGLFASAAGRQGSGSDIEQRGTTVPQRRTGTPEEIASVVAFLLSNDATYVTGEVLSVDGGSAWVSTVHPAGGAGRWDPSDIDGRSYDGQEERA
jgi:NAD(P)-dependent dehydrogenase (short-subunit alcohol dehydrogenase family)/glyoxylase-like metal-dependent hydrolase (beta-lactamase superfamily II)